MINPFRALGYGVWLAGEIVSGGVQVALDAFTPGTKTAPAIVEMPLRCRSDIEISLMASSITITPGTITIGIASAAGDHPPTLYVHALFADDVDALRQELRTMESHVLHMTRGTTVTADPDQEATS